MNMVPVIILTIFLLIYGYTPSITAVSCNYWEDNLLNLHADCKRMRLKLVPVVSSNVSSLNLNNNKIKVLENKTFSNLIILQNLDLSNNLLEWLNQEAFHGLQNLKTLKLDHNFLLYSSQHFSKSVFKPLKSLTYLNIGKESRGLQEFGLQTSWFSKNVISDLTTLQSIVIDFVSNSTDYIFREEFLLLTNLTNLKTGMCYMDANNKAFLNVPNIDTLDLSDCIIGSYADGTLEGLQLKYLQLRYTISGTETCYTENIINDLNKSSLQTLKLTHVCSNYGMNLINILFDFSDMVLQNYYMNKNVFSESILMEGDILPSSLTNLDCSYNELTSFCLSMPNLTSLNLEGNGLGDYLKSNTYYPNDPTSNPKNLVSLNLSFNKLYNLNISSFHGNRCLRNLNLSNNLLTDIDFDISHLRLLKVLDLSKNTIRKLSKQSMKQMNVVFDLSDIKINLAGNILQCSCDAIDFIEWIFDKKEYFIEKSQMKCKFLNETEIFLTNFEDTMLDLKKNCASYLVLIGVLCLVIISMIIVFTCGIVYKYRWKLRYIYYLTPNEYTRGNLTQNDDSTYKYDAFIAFSDDELNFVKEECISFLEKERNIRLCIHSRDFLAGRTILHNITSSIHESRNVICIISKSFLESYYCKFELQMARMESMYKRNGQDMLFLVFYEQLRNNDLPLDILDIMAKDSYIEYPNDEDGNKAFWDKLKESLA